MKTVFVVVAYIWIGLCTMAYAWDHEHFKDKSDKVITILFIPFWPMYIGGRVAFYFMRHIQIPSCSM